jgi:ABC-type transport system involved in multi-copper enzyme maturation permease subunit
MIAWAQLRAIAGYEFRMHWRRRALLVMILAFVVLTGASILIAGGSLLKPENLDETRYQQVVSAYAIFTAWMPLGVGLALILPVMVADTIPLDRQYGVRDLLDSLPVSRAVYLGGKLAGMWAAVLIGLGMSLAFVALAWTLRVGVFDLGSYVEMALVGAAAVAILNGGLGVLLAVGQPTRRRAILVVIGALALFIFVLPAITNNWDLRLSFNGQILNPLRMPIINRYLFNVQAEAGLSIESAALMVPPEMVRDTILAGLAELAAVWALAWGWLRWRDVGR